jgi:hypothetical protein
VLDFAIVLCSLLSMGSRKGSPLEMLSTSRVLRPLRVIARHDGMHAIMQALAKSVPGVLNVVLLLFLYFLVFSILGVSFFKGALGACQGDAFDGLSAAQKHLVTYPVPFRSLGREQQRWGNASSHPLGYPPTVGPAGQPFDTSKAVCEWLGAR